MGASLQITWRFKSRLLSLFEPLGGDVLYFAQKHITRRSQIELRRIPRGWVFNGGVVDRYRPASLIEFGAGKHLGESLYLSRPGLAQTVVDLNPMVDLSLVNRVIRQLRDRHGRGDLAPVASLDALRSAYGITYRAPVDMTATPFGDGAFEACVSTSTLEHIPVDTLEAILRELRRIVVPGGVVAALIDYSDHYAQGDKTIGWLNFLRFSEAEWRRHNHRFFFQNRLRHAHYRRLFEAAGFTVLEEAALKPQKDIPADLDPALLTGEDSDFCVTGQWVLRNG